ncbi:GNAT family N-acetyltransferase [Streptomyces sp. BV129]|uniref:GNAT family N-acetyltransferase n=1 Tax=Streptomyces sp. BV129 TaxID=2849671 RepID=UPI001C2DF873|nr:GNAT family N-acetyltransferase [Streptomyces sp. BV129]MBV1945319.1 GNAT family N-acetyltransferase [Streptomyces sp. BV129]
MTTTLRPTEPLRQHADGTRSRRFQVCVNSRPAGEVHLGTSPFLGPSVARVTELRIDEPDRRRGRGTVAMLAAEEVARGWGCRQIELTLPAGAEAASRLADVLGYVPRNRGMRKRLGDEPPRLPPGSTARPMTEAEFALWQAAERVRYAGEWIERGVPEADAHAKARRDHATVLPDGLATEGAWFGVLEHEGDPVGHVWLGRREGERWVYDVQTEEARRGRGHGRALMLLAEAHAVAEGEQTLGLNVFAGNTPAERLYESLGYETTYRTLNKALL